MKIRSCQINPEQVRLLLFKECDWKGRKLLFDSSTIEKVSTIKNVKPTVKQSDEYPCIVEESDKCSYLYTGPASDANLLGEMIFGAVAVNYKRVSFKVHIMEEPKRLMCTKVFCVPASRKISRADRKTDGRPTSCNVTARSGSKLLSVPLLKEEGVSLSISLDRGDSGFCGDLSPYSSMGSTCDYFSMFNIWDGKNSQDDVYQFHSPPGRKLSTSSNGSWQRRTFQNMATRFDVGNQSSNLLGVPSNVCSAGESQVYGSSTSGTSDSLYSAVSAPQRKNKLGLALLFTVGDTSEMDAVQKCVEHSPQLEALVCRLRLATMVAGAGGGFVSTLYKAACDAATWLSDLLYGPRLQPMWLSLATSEPRAANAAAEMLITELCAVLAIGDTKHTNFFISTLLTYMLTYHLGWVATVSPYDTVDACLETNTEPRRPYNALWAQLSDICGGIGFPRRAARTIISGTTNAQFINRLLLVLTYFVRCGDVKRTAFQFQGCDVTETKTSKNLSCELPLDTDLKKTVSKSSLKELTVNTQNSDIITSKVVPSEVSFKRSTTLANLSQKLSTESEFTAHDTSENIKIICEEPMSSKIRRNPTVLLPLKTSSDSSLNSSISEESEPEKKVVFVLGDDDKLVGLKNKSSGGKSVKKTTKAETTAKLDTDLNDKCARNTESPSRCCAQTLQHSKPIKHSGFKFEFDKYPQIVTNYMKSKNLEILDRHYIGKPGNLKLNTYQFDPTVVPPIQEERCESCYKCQLMESMLQTPTNASEMECTNDMPQLMEPQFAKETVVMGDDSNSDSSPKKFVRRRKENTVVVNVNSKPVKGLVPHSNETDNDCVKKEPGIKRGLTIEMAAPRLITLGEMRPDPGGFSASLLGGLTDHYVPDLVLQGTISKSEEWESELRRDLNLMVHLNKAVDSPIQAIAIIGDTNNWEVRVLGRDCGTGGMSPLVGGLLDALPAMRRANVPARQCLSYVESKLREMCILSKTLADMLMSTDFCDIATLTDSLSIDVNDVPLLLAVATTHTPQVAARYGISYR